MKRIPRRLLVISILLILAFSYSRFAVAQPRIPFDGLKLVYFSETTQAVQERADIYASAWITLIFHNVSASSSKLDINLNSSLTQNGQQQAVQLNRTIDFPTDRDTLIFLRNGGQDYLTIYAGPSGLTIPGLPGMTVDLTRSWNLHDKPLVRTPIGSFPAYRYHTALNSIPSPIGGTLNLDFYASYETTTQLLLSGEVWGSQSGFSAMIARIDLKETNLISTQGPSRCLIATATYGSELAPPVQFLRNFRDQEVEKTFAGSNFMVAFNLWYYSFSPAVARAIYSSPELRSAMQILLYPLIAILQLSAAAFGVFSFQPEMGALLAGLAASAMIGIFYLWVPSIFVSRRYGKGVKCLLKLMIIALGIGILGFVIAGVTFISWLAALSTATIVLSNLFLFATLPGMLLNENPVNHRVFEHIRFAHSKPPH